MNEELCIVEVFHKEVVRKLDLVDDDETNRHSFGTGRRTTYTELVAFYGAEP